MGHGWFDIFAFQESVVLQAVFMIAILAMIWIGFRRWLQYKEKMARLIAEQTAERAAEYGARIERVEARLKAVEEIVSDGGVQTAPQLEGPPTNHLPASALNRDEV